MLAKAKDKRRLQPGVHFVSIKGINIARNRTTMMPLEFTDKKTGEKYGAIEVVFMDKEQTGIVDKFLLGSRHEWILKKLMKAINLPWGADAQEAVGKKLWIVVACCFVYENQVIRTDQKTGMPMWFPKLLPEFFPANEERPSLKGNPQDNNGVAGPEFTLHQDSVLGIFTPTPNYISSTDLPEEGFGEL